MQRKRILAAVMSLCMVAGVASYGAPVISNTITAQAEAAAEAECYSFDETTGVLTLRGEVDGDAIRGMDYFYRHEARSIIAEEGTVLPENCSELFESCPNCTFIDLSNADTSKVTNMSYMFTHCSSLSAIDLSGIDTSNVTDMSTMFLDCRNLYSLDVSGFDTSKVTDMFGMFANCCNLHSLDVSKFDTSNVTRMGCMFEGCESLESLDVSSFDTSNVTDMNGMFYGCESMTSLDVSVFDTSKVTDMRWMFRWCDNLKSLVLGENFKNVPVEAELPNSIGWVNVNAPKTIVSGSDKNAVIENNGENTYIRFVPDTETPTYPTNIKVEYSKEYHQVKFTWDEVEGADRYGIAVYLAGKWRIKDQYITDTVFTTPKNLAPGKTYKVAIAAKVYGEWDIKNAIKNAGTVTIK